MSVTKCTSYSFFPIAAKQGLHSGMVQWVQAGQRLVSALLGSCNPAISFLHVYCSRMKTEWARLSLTH